MRISLVYPERSSGYVDPSSLCAHVSGLADALAERGHTVTLEPLPHDPRTRPGRAVQQLEKSWSNEPPDLVHAHLWASGLAVLSALRQSPAARRTPVVQTFHALETFDDDTEAHRREWLRLEAAVARGVNRIAASSRRQVADLVLLGARRRDIDVIPHGVDTELFTAKGHRFPRRDAQRLVTVGPMVPESGFDVVVNALRGLPQAELVIAGGRPPGQDESWTLAKDPETARLRALASRGGILDRLELLELPPRDELPALLRSADVVVCTPWHDAPGTAAIEAMACGRPVVGSAVSELLDVVIEGATGVLVPPRDPMALARALSELLRDPIRMDGFGLAAVDRARARHSWDRVTDEITRMYARTMAGVTGPREAQP